MARPPLLGSVQVTSMVVSPGVSVTVGASGAPAGTADASSDQPLSPMELEARNRTRYSVPLVNPPISCDVCVGSPTLWLPVGLPQSPPTVTHSSP